MDQKTRDKIASCGGNVGCAPDLNDGLAVLRKVRMVGVSNAELETPHVVNCSCGQDFQMITFETHCPNCGNVYAVTPCSSHDKNNIVLAGKDLLKK